MTESHLRRWHSQNGLGAAAMPPDYRGARRMDCVKRPAAAWRRPGAAPTRSPPSADTPAYAKWNATPEPRTNPAWRAMRWPGSDRQHPVANRAVVEWLTGS